MDLISREAAITAIQKAYVDTEGGTDKCAVWKNVGLTNALHIMQDLPSAQPDVSDTNVGDMISRQAAIDVISVGAELLRRVLDDVNVVGAQREKYEWGLGLIESYISDIKELPPVQSEIIHCKDCKYNTGDYKCLNPDSFFVVPADDDFCSFAERREE